MSQSKSQETPHVDSMSGCLVRLCWMALGNGALLLLGAHIAVSRQSFPAAVDLAFWLTVLFALGARYLDITRFHGQTVTCEPATLGHWRRYAVLMPLFSLGLWLLSHGLAFLLEPV